MHPPNAHMVRLHEETLTYNGKYMYEPCPGHLILPITLLFVDRNIKCGYSFSYLERAEQVETKIEQIRRNFLFCNKTASSTATPFIDDLSDAAS